MKHNLAVVGTEPALSDERQNLIAAQRRRAESSAASENVHRQVSLLCVRKTEAEARIATRERSVAEYRQQHGNLYRRWVSDGAQGEAPALLHASEVARLEVENERDRMAVESIEAAIADLQEDVRAAQSANLDALAGVNGAVVGVAFYETFLAKAERLMVRQRENAAELADLLAFERWCVIEGHRGNHAAGVRAGEAGRIVHKCRQLEVVNPEAGVPKWTAFANRLFADATVEF